MENENQTHNMKGGNKTNTELYIQLAIIGFLVIVVVFAAGRIYSSNITGNSIGTGIGTVSASEIIPKGTPKIYGEELRVKYDDISASNSQATESTIGILGDLDNSISLSGNDMQRYIDIASQISCEYCCGADSIIFSNGKAACGCAHSYAMRGLAKYLIKNHGNEYTDDEILEELGKWKVLFFPGIHEQKASVLKSKGIEINYINLASNKYRGIEKGQTSGGGMVGGC